MTDHVDCVVVGAGVVGLAIAAKLCTQGYEVIVLEQHSLIGSETSSRNSEVIHAGIYYPQNSLKAQFCVAGKHLLYDFCKTYNVAFNNCGKLIVASNKSQIPTVQSYIKKATDNGVDDLYWLDAADIGQIEPHVECVGGVMSPSTGVIDSHEYMTSLHGIVEEHGGSVALQSKVNQLEHRDGLNYVLLDNFELACNICVNAAGLAAPTLALDTQSTNWSVPNPYYARGHYYSYSGQAPFSRLIYPVAEPGGLGVHVTLDIAGQVKFGPDVQWIDEIDYSFDGRDKAHFVDAIRKYYPAIDESRLHPSYTGIRPKISPPGSEFTDFRIDLPKHHGLAGRVNLLGIESPGLTASLAIAEYVAAHISVDNN